MESLKIVPQYARKSMFYILMEELRINNQIAKAKEIIEGENLKRFLSSAIKTRNWVSKFSDEFLSDYLDDEVSRHRFFIYLQEALQEIDDLDNNK